jgi:malic enzyme
MHSMQRKLRMKIIVSGAGSAALACANLYVQLG